MQLSKRLFAVPHAGISLAFALILLLNIHRANAQTSFSLEEHEEGVRILRNGELVSDYLKKSGAKPILWPLNAPDGTKLTRNFPMDESHPDEVKDHPWHRSMWFTHGEVNNNDFWTEGRAHAGHIDHQEFTRLESGEQAHVGAINHWIGENGDALLKETRLFTFGGDETSNWIDCQIELTPIKDPVHFGDTKEGSFGVRVAHSMSVDAKQGGTIVTSRGDKDGDTWGKQAEWVDYNGPIGEKTYGIAILCHPTTHSFPNRFHVRTYGLFAANPFGVHHFLGAKEPTPGVTLKPNEKLSLRYMIVLHDGNAETAKISERYAAYAKQ